jgi:hypothetical protein
MAGSGGLIGLGAGLYYRVGSRNPNEQQNDRKHGGASRYRPSVSSCQDAWNTH